MGGRHRARSRCSRATPKEYWLDRLAHMIESKPQFDKLVLRILVIWFSMITVRVLSQFLGGR